jgi:hypothetical protein
MTQRSITSQLRQRDFADAMAGDFEHAPIHNLVHDDIREDFQLAQVCKAANAIDEAHNRRANYYGGDAAFIEEIEDAWGTLSFVTRQRTLEVVAAACQTIVRDGEQWVADGHWDAEEMREAKREVRAWMQAHTNEMERVGGIPDNRGEEHVDLPLPNGVAYDIDDTGDGTIVVQWWHDTQEGDDR